MNKTDLILKYFQKAGRLTTENEEYSQPLIRLFKWLMENDGIGNDKSSKYLPNIPCNAEIVSKDNGIIAGLEEVKYLLKTNSKLSFASQLTDGDKIKKGDVIAQITGKSHEILSYERTILNILQRMSGIATETNRTIDLIHHSHPISFKTKSVTYARDRLYMLFKTINFPFIAATRKTPWMMLDKKAVAAGGGLTHRLNLSDGILVKDNHLAQIRQAFHLKNDQEAIEKILEILNSKLKTQKSKIQFKNQNYIDKLIEIEVKNEKEAYAVINTYNKLTTNYPASPAGRQLPTTNHVLAIMFDNFTPSSVSSLLSDLSGLYDLSNIIFEASGRIDEKNILEWTNSGVDIISLGSLTHSARAFNLSLEMMD